MRTPHAGPLQVFKAEDSDFWHPPEQQQQSQQQQQGAQAPHAGEQRRRAGRRMQQSRAASPRVETLPRVQAFEGGWVPLWCGGCGPATELAMLLLAGP